MVCVMPHAVRDYGNSRSVIIDTTGKTVNYSGFARRAGVVIGLLFKNH